MGAKCNITSSLIAKLNKLHWGINSNDVEDIILENYAEFLACPTIDLIICNPDNCSNNTINVVCSLAVAKITSSIVNNVVTFSILGSDISNGLAPYTYTWSFNSNDFTNSGNINSSTLSLSPKTGKKLELIVSNISVAITDANGCSFTKTCYITSIGMQCDNSYIPCLADNNLIVANKITQCVAPSSLLVFKKQ